MKLKHTAALLLALVMAAVPAAAFAAPGDTEKDSEAGIEFKKGENPGIIPPTGDIEAAGLHFGLRELSTSSATYFSTDENVGIDDRDKLAGLMVSNPDNDNEWKVTVTISDFIWDNNEDETTLDGFRLYLLGQQNSIEGDHNGDLEIPSRSDELYPEGDEVLVMKPEAGKNAGTFGANYAGELFVPLGSARLGEAQATMTWNFQSVPGDDE